uniref:Uncharacterized protein n=1 Tax=Amphimedon queenslandica TaxID=400682 RepID=A0A1X7STP4_AMPQE
PRLSAKKNKNKMNKKILKSPAATEKIRKNSKNQKKMIRRCSQSI